MQETTNYKLKKPDLTDYVNVGDLNENMDVIDEELKRQDEEVDNVANDLEAHKADYASFKEGIELKTTTERTRKITFGTADPDPTQMEEGEVYFQYE